MIVSQLEPQKKRSTRYNLYLDGEFFEGLDESTVALFRLYVGKELTEDDCNEIRACEVAERLHARMIWYLGRYRKTVAEARRYILDLEYSSQAADEEIKRLREYKFLDDRSFAQDFVSSNTTYGSRMLRQKLALKGIPRDIIDETIGEDDTDALYRIAVKKWKSLKDKPKAVEKLMRFCIGRGFSYDDVRNVVQLVEKDDSE